MPQRPREIHRPPDLASAAAWLSRTDLTIAPLRLHLRPAPLTAHAADILLDLSRLDLNYIRFEGDRLRLGANTPLQALIDSPVTRAYAGGLLAEAAGVPAPLPLRNAVTVGSALVTVDGPPEFKLALRALNAEERVHASANLLTEVALPVYPPSGVGAALARVARAPRDEALAAAAAVVVVRAGECVDGRVFVDDFAPAGRAQDGVAPELLVGRRLTEDLLRQVERFAQQHAQPRSDFRASADYRRAMAGVMARRALESAWQQAAA